MARRQRYEHLEPGTRVRKAARLVLTVATRTTFACLEPALRGEVEAGIHDMRVNAKQLREGMRLFRPVYRRESIAPALAEVDALNDHLGLVRDADVLLEHLAELSEQTGLTADLQAVVASGRAQHQAALNRVLEQLAGEEFEQRLLTAIADERFGRHHAVAGQACRRFARSAISRRLNRVINRMEAVKGEDDGPGLHRVRVANKQLRYAIEPFLTVFDRRLTTAYHRVAELHSTLGDLHDLDVLAETLTQFAGSAREQEAAPLLEEVEETRRREYGRAFTFFGEESDTTFVRLVADAID
ncbi:MAG: CHAD domain-containing protein [Armatimonadetes bacterium]|nr:CHAD domain-containing protein [Armatimonadota bacterium]